MSAFLLGVLVGFGGLLALDVLLFLAMVWAAARAEDGPCGRESYVWDGPVVRYGPCQLGPAHIGDCNPLAGDQ